MRNLYDLSKKFFASKYDLLIKYLKSKSVYDLLKTFFVLCNSHTIIHLFLFFYLLGLGTVITFISVLGIICGIITTAIIIKKDMSLKIISIYNFSFFVILGVIMFSGFYAVISLIAVIIIALIFCIVRSLSFGIKRSDVFYEKTVFVLINPLIHSFGYFLAIGYEISKEPNEIHFP